MPNRIGTNPFASVGGWLVNPMMREAALRTLGSTHVTAVERYGLAAMARSPSAFWIDTASKVHRPVDLT